MGGIDAKDFPTVSGYKHIRDGNKFSALLESNLVPLTAKNMHQVLINSVVEGGNGSNGKHHHRPGSGDDLS